MTTAIRSDGSGIDPVSPRRSSYDAILATSETVAWTVDEVFRDRGFDATQSFVPASWVRTDTLAFLDEHEQRVLNHCRAFSYVHLLGNFEEFAPPHVGGLLERDWHDDRTRLRALLRFADEEMKHQQLLRRAELELERSCGHPFGRYFDDEKRQAVALTATILGYPPLPRFLIVLALEWGTQRHYVESIRDRADGYGDPLYVDILKAHWIEEAQHVKIDVLEIERLARRMRPESLVATFDDVVALGSIVDAAFSGQAMHEIATLEYVTGRRFNGAETTRLHGTLHRSLGAILAGVGLSHPSFAAFARDLSADGAAMLGIR